MDFVNVLRPAPNCVDIVRFGPKWALTTLKHIYRIMRSYLHGWEWVVSNVIRADPQPRYGVCLAP